MESKEKEIQKPNKDLSQKLEDSTIEHNDCIQVSCITLLKGKENQAT